MEESTLSTFPPEIWLGILRMLDLASQRQICSVAKEFSDIVTKIWRGRLVGISRRVELTVDDTLQDVRQKLVMRSLFKDLHFSLDALNQEALYSLLMTYNVLKNEKGEEDNYEFFHDHDKTGVKWLDLKQKWPRPGAKSLSRFSQFNHGLAFLSVTDCRENIEAVHHLLSHCQQLEGLRLLATDPLMPYTEVLKLKRLKYLELQFDSFYRDHREGFIHCLNQLPNLQVLKLLTCYGLTDEHVISLMAACSSTLISLHLPYNSRIQGWCLESLSQCLVAPSVLRFLRLTINTAYVELSTVVPELHARNIQRLLREEFDVKLEINFVHRKLSSFNPKDMDFL